MKKTLLKGSALLSGLIVSGAALAGTGGGRIVETQGEYIGGAVEIFILVFNAILFLASLIILLAGGWFMIKDYVLAKADHEKSFSIGKLAVAMVVASLLGYPSGAYLLGQDLTTGEVGGNTMTNTDFERPQ